MELESFFYDSTAFKRFLSDNPHERSEVGFLESILEEGMNAIDIGGAYRHYYGSDSEENRRKRHTLFF